jgi:proline iminopeptidase
MASARRAASGGGSPVTPARTAHALHKLWPASQLRIVPDAGHATNEPGICAALVSASDELRPL